MRRIVRLAVIALIVVSAIATGHQPSGPSADAAAPPAATVRAFGTARSFGNLPGPVSRPVVGFAAHPSSKGYWLVAADGGIFSFGAAPFRGSTGNIRLNQPIVGMAPHPSGKGYWLVAADGGIFSFGTAAFRGSMAPSMPAGNAALGMASTRDGRGYWVAAAPSDLKLMFAGDVHGERQIRQLLDSGGNPLDAVAPLLRQADLTVVNLETPVGSGGAPQSKEFVFLAPPSLTHALRAGGVDVVSLANNHALDHGTGALLETIDHARRAGLVVVGAGANASEAYRPAFVRTRGRSIAVVGLSRVVPPGWAASANGPGVASAYDERAALGAVSSAAAQADAVAVVIHWGTELARCPDGALLSLAARLRQAGADVVAGHHSHVLQGIRPEGDGLVAYSLGNFVWYHNQPPSGTTGVLETTVNGGRVVGWRFLPAAIDESGRPRPLSGSAAEGVRREVAALTPGGGQCPG